MNGCPCPPRLDGDPRHKIFSLWISLFHDENGRHCLPGLNGDLRRPCPSGLDKEILDIRFSFGEFHFFMMQMSWRPWWQSFKFLHFFKGLKNFSISRVFCNILISVQIHYTTAESLQKRYQTWILWSYKNIVEEAKNVHFLK